MNTKKIYQLILTIIILSLNGCYTIPNKYSSKERQSFQNVFNFDLATNLNESLINGKISEENIQKLSYYFDTNKIGYQPHLLIESFQEFINNEDLTDSQRKSFEDALYPSLLEYKILYVEKDFYLNEKDYYRIIDEVSNAIFFVSYTGKTKIKYSKTIIIGKIEVNIY